ncbi:hypothetical protein M0R45_011014 [Rubus argutus]|uniref:Uncharacterized protein n=1 Tax=Rubus argutus TaxID=59490 RepID=A0AAW1Y8S0_RUBAR
MKNRNPKAIIKKQREFYKNAKYVNKYKKSVKQQQTNVPSAIRPLEEENETADGSKMSQNDKKRKKTESTRRKAVREKMMKRTHKGQPVMKYRIQHLLETIQGSMNKS